METIFGIEGPWSGKLAIIARPRGDEWLESDLKRWRQKGIDAVVSLLTPAETTELSLRQEADVAAKHGILFISFPIEDRSVPVSLQATLALTRRLIELLEKGKNVGIHCRQGVGRSALVAAGLLASSGINVETAFRRIAAARGCPVPDTPEQRQWVEKLAHVAAWHVPA